MANLTSKNRLEKTCCKAGPLSRFVHWVYAMYDYVYIHVCIYIRRQLYRKRPFTSCTRQNLRFGLMVNVHRTNMFICFALLEFKTVVEIHNFNR